jgi:hypothetical protein
VAYPAGDEEDSSKVLHFLSGRAGLTAETHRAFATDRLDFAPAKFLRKPKTPAVESLGVAGVR